MVAIVIINFLELICDLVPISLPYLHTGHVRSLSICFYWATANYTLQGLSAWFTAWASIDRYLLIFGHRVRNTFVKHDLPLLIICIFVVGWYISVTVTHRCDAHWFDGTQFLCGGPCFDSDRILIVLLPALLIIAFNLLLFGRVMFQKYRHHPGFQKRSFTWRKNRKLLIQLLPIAFVFLTAQVPLVILSLVHLFGPADFLIDVSSIWLYYAPYLIYIVTPFAYIATTKECQKRICGRRHHVAAMAVIPLNQPKLNPTLI
jgi:hypothetical protein